MSKLSTLFACSNCDAQYPKWSGRCLECGQWGTLVEMAGSSGDSKKTLPLARSSDTIPFSQIDVSDTPRQITGLTELDQVLGGGLVAGSLILLGGEPGIGKSTILLQISALLAEQGKPVLYCSGEESAQQVKLRFDRLFSSAKRADLIGFLPETNTEKVCATIIEQKPILAIVDSIQTIHSSEIMSEAGSLAQVRACTVKLLETAKQNNVAIIIVGHVTKDGTVAGPKTLEHLVDTVLYLEGDHNNFFRLLKTAKNRFGSTNEVGVFEMTEGGLKEVANPSEVFLGDRQGSSPGTVTTVIMEGTRAFMVQVQALTTKSYFGLPARRAVGFDSNRLQLLLAVLAKRLGLNLGDQDVHINVVAGIKISEPAADLAICASIISAL